MYCQCDSPSFSITEMSQQNILNNQVDLQKILKHFFIKEVKLQSVKNVLVNQFYENKSFNEKEFKPEALYFVH